MNSRRTIGSRPLVGSSSTSNSGSGQIAPIERQLRFLSFREVAGLLVGIELKAFQQIGFDVAIPMFAERGEIFQRVAHGHPRIKRDHVRHVGEPRFDGHFVLLRVEAEHARRAGIRAEQIQQALDGRGLARAVAAEKAVAFPGADSQTQAVHRVQLAIAAVKVVDFDDGSVGFHDVAFPLIVCLSTLRSK